MKAQMLVEFETGQVICTSVDKGRVHDFKLLKRSRLPFVPSQLCLADKGSSWLRQTASGRLSAHKEAPQPTAERSAKAA